MAAAQLNDTSDPFGATMGKDRGVPTTQSKLDKFARPAGGGQPPADAPGVRETSPSDNLILGAISDLRTSIEGKIGDLHADISLIRQDLRNTVDRVTETEGRVSEIEDSQRTCYAELTQLRKTVKQLELRAEDAEGRSRRNNIRLVGFPEGCEGRDPTDFVLGWLRSWLPASSLSNCFIVERAHRGPTPKPPVGAPPRPMIARLLNFADRDMILREARKAGSLRWESAAVMIFPDYTFQVQQQRRSFLGAKRKLRDLHIQYMLLFPARLNVIYNEKSHFFDMPEAAWDWMETKHGVSRSNADCPDPGDHPPHKMNGWSEQQRRRRPSAARRRNRSRGPLLGSGNGGEGAASGGVSTSQPDLEGHAELDT